MNQIVIDLAARMFKVTTREQIKRVTWLPFTLLYDESVREKAIEPISSLSKEQKLKYWNETEGSRHRRVFVCQALYLYDLINQKT